MTVTAVAGPPTRSGEVVLEARGLTAGYGGTPAVHGLDLEVHAGEIVALLGANGAGKTTTLLTLAGDLQPISGSVVMHGDRRRRRLHQRARQGLGFLTEERCVFMGLTGWQNLSIGRGTASRCWVTGGCGRAVVAGWAWPHCSPATPAPARRCRPR